MSRTKTDIIETEAMLTRLTNLLVEHRAPNASPYQGIRADAESLRRISMTLHRWHELECGIDDVHIERQGDEATGKPFMYYDGGIQKNVKPWPTPDREAGARKRLAQILKRYPTLQAYVQTDPRGCALYILKPGDVPEGQDVSSCYSRGLAVYR